MRSLLLLALTLSAHAGKKDREAMRDAIDDATARGPAASASEIPALAQLLAKAGWTPTPEMSGIFEPGVVFTDNGVAHTLLTSNHTAL